MSSKLAIARAYFAARCRRVNRGSIEPGPICDEQEMAEHFEKYNSLGVSLPDAREIARQELATGQNPYPGYSFGLSSGTLGEPGVFITTELERDRWLGTILGKFLSMGQIFHLNAALLLKHNNSLYNASGRVAYYDLSTPVAQWAPRLCDQAPNVLVGPPSVLTAVANSAAFQRRPFHPHTLLCGAEALFPQDCEYLTKAFQKAPRNIYQAKEGFLAAGCVHGPLHWNEDLMAVEWLRFRGRPDRAVPVFTDFTRESQTFRRYRLDDVVVLDPGARCSCRTPFQKVTTVEGRLQDVLLRASKGSEYEPLFPLDLNEVLRYAGDYVLIQHDPDYFTLACNASPPNALLQELRGALRDPARLEVVPLRALPPGQKRRRFQRLFDLENRIILDGLLEPPVQPLQAPAGAAPAINTASSAEAANTRQCFPEEISPHCS